MQVANIDVKGETPVDHGELICFSIYPGPEADFGDKKSCIWVDVLDGDGKDLLKEFAPFFEDPSIKKVRVLQSSMMEGLILCLLVKPFSTTLLFL